MNRPIISPICRLSRTLAAVLAVAACHILAPTAGATQIFSRFVGETSDDVSLVPARVANLPPNAAENEFDVDPGLIDARQLPSLFQALGDQSPGREELALGKIDPAAWLEALVSLVASDAPTLDLSVNPIVAKHALGATLLAFEAFGDSSYGDSSDWERTMFLTQRPSRPDGFVMQEVTAALQELATPEPDFLFLVFLAVQSVWAIASRPRPA